MQIALAERGHMMLEQNLLEHLGVQPGAQVRVQKMPGGRLEIAAEDSGDWDAAQAKAYFRRLFADNTVHASVEDMNAAIARGYAASGLGSDDPGC